MVHATVTQAVGKRVVGKQNILPLMRDAAEDIRQVSVCVDTDRTRYNARNVEAVSGRGREEYAVLGGQFVGGRSRITVRTTNIIAFQITEVGPDPDSIVGKALAAEQQAENSA